MKKYSSLIGTTFLFACLLPFLLVGQQTICYPLNGDLLATEQSAPPLGILPNTQGQNGEFITTPLPANFCPQGGNTTAFHFEDNVGLTFNNTAAGFIDCEYTVAFTVNFEQLPANTLFDSPWIWVFGTYEDDDGIFIWRDILFGGLYIEFWDSNDRLKTVRFDDFNTTDWFHFTITRDCNGQVRVYINCTFFTDFNDTRNILRLHPSTGNNMIFFQDDPALIVGEASPGKVKDIHISNYIKEEPEVLEECNCLCETAETQCPINVTRDSLTCDPSLIGIRIDTIPVNISCSCSCDSIITTNFILAPNDQCITPCEELTTTDTLLCPGSLFNAVLIEQDTTVCDTTTLDPNCVALTCTDIQLLPTFSSELDTAICAGESVLIGNQVFENSGNYDMLLTATNGCDSLISLALTVIDEQPITVDTMLCAGMLLEDVPIFADTSFCRTLSGAQGCETMLCYNARIRQPENTQIQELFCPGSTFSFGDTVLQTPGIYTQTFTDRNGCDSLVQLQLDTVTTPTVFIDTTLCFGTAFEGVLVISDTLICQTVPDAESCFINQCYRVIADSVYVFEQHVEVCRGDAFIVGDSTYYAPGTYLHRFQADNGCDSVIAYVLKDRLPPNISISGSTSICHGQTSVLNAGSGFATYEWSPTGDTTQIISIQSPGTYTVKVTDQFGCQNERNVEVTETPPIEVNINILQPEHCPDSHDAVLEAVVSGGTAPFTYHWNDSSASPFLSGLTAGTYEVLVRDEAGCSKRDTVTLESAIPFSVQTEVNASSCPESADGFINVIATGGSGPFLYRLDNGSFQTASTFNHLPPGDYTLTVEDMEECRQSIPVSVLGGQSSNLIIDPSESIIQLGDSVTLNLVYDQVPAIETVSWMPMAIFDCDSCISVSASPIANTEVLVTVVDTNGCVMTAAAWIEVMATAPEVDSIDLQDRIFVPNAFSPNGDGINDELIVYAHDTVEGSVSMHIFNRWGELIYTNDSLLLNQSTGTWDGKINGRAAPAGAYLWWLEASLPNGSSKKFTGTVTIVK